MAPVRVARAFRLPIIAAMTALALSGCMHRTAPVAVAPQPTLDSIAYAGPAPMVVTGGPAAVPVAYAAPAPASYDVPYHLDAGDRLRIVVYGQEGLTNTYSISAGGTITMPLIGSVPARGRTPQGLAAEITARLRNGFIREPSVEVESYRPFFILGEVPAPGQYPYVPNMTAESAVAIAGGNSPRARRDRVTITHVDGGADYALQVACGVIDPRLHPIRLGGGRDLGQHGMAAGSRR